MSIGSRTTKMLLIASAMLFSVLHVSSASAQVFNESVDYYYVDGSTADAIKRDLAARGPGGYWAVARWNVTWTADCRVSGYVAITMPRHRNRGAMAPDLRNRWDSMISALLRHERVHGAHARNAARDIAQNNCVGGREIKQWWSGKDKEFDRATNHGLTQGVHF